MKQSTSSTANPEVREGRQFESAKGKQYVVVAEDGCFYSGVGQPIYGWFGARTLKDGRPFGPMRDMKTANIARWL